MRMVLRTIAWLAHLLMVDCAGLSGSLSAKKMHLRSLQCYIVLHLLLACATCGSIAQLQVSSVTASGTVDASYSWTFSKELVNTQSSLSIPVGGTATASYIISVGRTIVTQTVTVKGTFQVSRGDSSDTSVTLSPTLTFSTAPGSGQATSQQVNCIPATLQTGQSSTCTFQSSWTDTSVTAAQSGTVTVSVGAAGDVGSGRYDIRGGSASTGTGTGSCATLSDSFTITAGSTAVSSSVAAYSTNLNGLQVCDTNTYPYTVTFSNLDSSLCGTPITATNKATLTIDGESTPRAQSQTVTLSLTGCAGATAAVGDIQTVVIQTYTWALSKTGGGSGLTTDPMTELSIPFTITATQNAPTTVGYVAGKVSVTNTATSPATISGLTVTLSGQAAVSIPVSNCATPSLPARATTSCSFNVSNPTAPAAGSVTASVTFAGVDTPTNAPAAAYDYQTAQQFNIGGTATIIDVVSTDSLRSIISGVTTSLVRYEPPDGRPPSSSPGLTIDGSRTFQYRMIITSLGSCARALTVSNTATLTPQGGSTQGSLTSSASATFDVIGCNVLPTLGLSNMQQWAAVTWTWQMTKTASPNTYQFAPGQGGNANYQVALTRNRQSGTYFLSGTLQINNPASYAMYISSVTLTSTAGQFGALSPNCLGGSNVGATNTPLVGTGINTVPASGLSGQFFLAAGAQLDCVFNISAGTGSPPQGTVRAMATTSTTVIGAAGNAAYSQDFPVNFASPTQQWDIGGCVKFSDTATTQGAAGSWIPQMSGLPQQQEICESRTWTYTGAISAVPVTGATCNVPVTITNNAQAAPVGGGASVTSSATVQVIAIDCPANSPTPGPPPTPSPAPPTPQSLQPPVVTVNPGVAAAVAGDYVWAVSIQNSAGGSMTMPYSDNRQVRYTVTATRTESAAANTVKGEVTVANPNTAPLSVNSVSVTLSGGADPVAAVCPEKLPIVLPAGGNVVCSFTGTVTSAEAGRVSATASSSAGIGTTAQSVQYSFSTATTAGSNGKCAVISDEIASLPIFTATSFAVTDSRPAGNSIIVCSDTTYTFTASLGPFTSANCGVQTVTATATATPTDGPQTSAPPKAQSSLSLEITGCQTVQSATEVNVVVGVPSATTTSRVAWKGSGTPSKFANRVTYTQTVQLQYNMTWQLVEQVITALNGTVIINNPTTREVTVSSVEVEPEWVVDDDSGGAIPTFQATCQVKVVQPKQSVECSYSTEVQGSGTGVVRAEVLLQVAGNSSRRIQSDDTSFNAQDTTSAASRNQQQQQQQQQEQFCARVVTGLTMGTALLLPGAAKGITSETKRVCESGSTVVTQTVGPFPETGCGSYTVASVMRIRPAVEEGPNRQDAFAVITPAQVVVIGCPLSTVPKPMVTIAPKVDVKNVVTHDWRAQLTSNAPNRLVVRYNQPKEVVVRAALRRLEGRRSASVQGAVQLQAQGRNPIPVYKVQAAGLSRTGELIVVNATCPANNVQNGVVQLPPLRAKVLCTFLMTELPPMDGPVMALVYADRDARTPLPTDMGTYRIAGALREAQGDCVAVGSSRSLRKASSASAVPGQPARSGAGIPVTPICRSTSANTTLTFGPFQRTECGKYVFKTDISADLTNSPSWVNKELSFDVNVVGCP